MIILNPRIKVDKVSRIRRFCSNKRYKVYLEFGIEVETRSTRTAQTDTGFESYVETTDEVESSINSIKSKILQYSRKINIIGPEFLNSLNIHGDNHMIIINEK